MVGTVSLEIRSPGRYIRAPGKELCSQRSKSWNGILKLTTL